MINIYYSKRNIDQEKFVYQNIKKSELESLVIVPEQYNLVSTMKAFDELEKRALFQVDITSFSRLIKKILDKTGFSQEVIISKSGRLMLLSKALKKCKRELEVFGTSADKISFAEEIDKIIEDFQEKNIGVEELSSEIKKLEEGKKHLEKLETKNKDVLEGSEAINAENKRNHQEKELLEKLRDLELIMIEYLKELGDEYIDSEGAVEKAVENLEKSNIAGSKEIWIYAFDELNESKLKLIKGLEKYAKDVNILVTTDKEEDSIYGELFESSNYLIEKILRFMEDEDINVNIKEIPLDYEFRGKTQTLKIFEKEVFKEKIDRKNQKKSRVHSLDIEEEKNSYSEVDINKNLSNIESNSYDEMEKIEIEYNNLYSSLSVVESISYREEVEKAASFVNYLIREKGYRYKDIAVIYPEESEYEDILKRKFGEYGIKVFDDRKTEILNSAIISLVIGIIEVVAYGYRTKNIIQVLKSGFLNISSNQVEAIENYCKSYKITGNRWKKPFEKGLETYKEIYGEEKGTEKFEEILASQRNVNSFFDEFSKIYNKSKTNEEFLVSYYNFLNDEVELNEKISQLADKQRKIAMSNSDDNLLRKAEETEQIGNLTISIFEEIYEFLGKEEFSGKDFIETFVAGVRGKDVGVLPTSVDQVIISTLDRLKLNEVKVLLVLGLNEGLIPKIEERDNILSEVELEEVFPEKYSHSKNELQYIKDNLTLYQKLTLAKDYLYLSYADTGLEMEELHPSEIIIKVREVFENLTKNQKAKAIENEKKGILDYKYYSTKDYDDQDLKLVLGGRINNLMRYGEVQKLKDDFDDCSKRVLEKWRIAREYLKESDLELVEALESKKSNIESLNSISKENAEKLFGLKNYYGERRLTLSPTRVEKFSACPFNYLVQYGLKPKSTKAFESTNLELGNLYHNVIFGVNDSLSKGDSRSIEELVELFFNKEIEALNEGIFKYNKLEKYKSNRAKKLVTKVCNIVQKQSKTLDVEKSYNEVEFKENGEGFRLKPIIIQGENAKFQIEGKIDRLTYTDREVEGKLEKLVTVVDYKTSDKKLNENEIKEGYTLQLIIYLMAGLGEEIDVNDNTIETNSEREEAVKKPLGAFYFGVNEIKYLDYETVDSLEFEELKEALIREFEKEKRLEGLLVRDNLPVDDDEVRKIWKANGRTIKKLEAGSGSIFIKEEETLELVAKVENKIKEICEDILKGDAKAFPKKIFSGVKGEKTACNYCEFQSICKFEENVEGFEYDKIYK